MKQLYYLLAESSGGEIEMERRFREAGGGDVWRFSRDCRSTHMKHASQRRGFGLITRQRVAKLPEALYLGFNV